MSNVNEPKHNNANNNRHPIDGNQRVNNQNTPTDQLKTRADHIVIMSSNAHELSAALLDAIAASNQTRPATVYTTTNRAEAVQLRLGEADGSTDSIALTDPLSIPALLHRTATQFADTVALRFKATPTPGGGDATAADWQSVTFRLVLLPFEFSV